MPYYDYKCIKCNNVFEIEKGMKEKPKNLKCPSCGNKEAKRVFTRPRILTGTAEILKTEGTSGLDCNTCVDGMCSTCKTKG